MTRHLNADDANAIGAMVGRWAGWFAAPLVVLLFLLPLVYLVSGSLKTDRQLRADPFAIVPSPASPENYAAATRQMPLLRYLTNTAILCFMSALGTAFSCTMAGYAFARLRWRGRKVLFAILIATMLLPWHVTMIPRFLLIRQIGLYDSLAAIWLPTFFGTAFYIFLLRQFFLSLPPSLLEAGRMDGLSEWGVFWKIALPLSRPAVATVLLFQVVATWNDFSGPMLYLSDPQKFPIAYGLEQFVSGYSDQTNLLLAASVLLCLPPIGLFLLAQRYFVDGIQTSGIK
ncbi:MAG: carbohydrate ABC transporter permease [Planctomycetota bacterium]